MRHYAARQKERDGKWHYTCCHDRAVYPVGPCANGCPGHETAAEACEHYRQHLITQARYCAGNTDADILHRCEAPGCAKFTAGYAVIQGHLDHKHLCDLHRTPEIFGPMVTVGEEWVS